MLPYFTYGCAHTCCWAWGFICFLAVLRPPSGSGSTGSSGYSSPLGFPPFAMGSPLRGRGLFVLDRNEGLVSPFGSGLLVSSWLDLTPPFCRLGFVPRSVAQLCALQPLAPSFLVVLTEAAGLGWFLVLSIVLSWPWVCFQVHLLCSASCQLVVFWAWRLLLRVRLRPLPDDSLGALGLPERLL